MNAKIERDLKVQGKVVDGNEVLRPHLRRMPWRQNASSVLLKLMYISCKLIYL